MTNPLVSVVVPIFNGARFLGEALDSIYAQTYRPFEICAVDDGSRDDSLRLLSDYATARSGPEQQVHVRTRKRRGIATTRNDGIAAGSGEFVAFLDQDDMWDANKLEIQVEHLIKHVESDCVMSAVVNFLEAGFNLPDSASQDLTPGIRRLTYFFGAMLARRSVFERFGMLNTERNIPDDIEWMLRVKRLGGRVDYIPDVLLRRRIHEANTSWAPGGRERVHLALARNFIQRHRAERALAPTLNHDTGTHSATHGHG